MNYIQIIIIVSLGLLLATCFFILFETIAEHFFMRFPFYNGLLIYKKNRVKHHFTASTDKIIIKTNNGEFKQIKPGLCLFRKRFELFVVKQVTPFAIRGVIKYNEHTAHIEGRLPLGTTFFLILCLFLGAAFTLVIFAESALTLKTIYCFICSLFVMIFGLWFFISSIRYETSLTDKRIDELNEYWINHKEGGHPLV